MDMVEGPKDQAQVVGWRGMQEGVVLSAGGNTGF